MNKIENLFIGAVVPLSLLNIFGGVVSGVWLAILGEWRVIGTGVLALFVSGMALGLAMMPGLIFSLPAAAMLERGNKIGGYIFTFLSLGFFASAHNEENKDSLKVDDSKASLFMKEILKYCGVKSYRNL